MIPSPPTSSHLRNLELSDPRLETDGLRFLTITTPNLAGRGDITLFVPPEARSRESVPLVLLLHGVYGSHWGWALRGAAHKTASRLIASGKIPPLVLAMPSDGLEGQGSGYVPYVDGSRNFERWIVDDVPETVRLAESCVDLRSPCFIAGLSMGGFGALRLAGAYPKRFHAVSAHSSVTHFDQLKRFVAQPLARAGVDQKHQSVLETFLRNRQHLSPIRFDCGTEDGLLPYNRDLHHALVSAGIPHIYQEFPGGHDWAYWEAHLEDTLRFFASTL